LVIKNIASVVISNCTREFDKEYHYQIPENIKGIVKPGMRVIVPFGRSNILKEAYVLDVLDSSSWDNLKSIKKLLDKKPVLSKNMLKLSAWMKDKYICTYHDSIKCILPAGIGVKAYRVVVLEDINTNISKDTNLYSDINISENQKKIIDTLKTLESKCELTELKNKVNLKSFQSSINSLEKKGVISIHERYTTRVKEKFIKAIYTMLSKEDIAELIEGNKLKRIQQIKVMEMLMDNEFVSVQDIIRFTGVSPGVLDTLKKYGYIEFTEIETKREPFGDEIFEKTLPLKLTEEQNKIFGSLKGIIDKNKYSECLIHGVTGSGKTELYMQIIQHIIKKGKKAIVLVPEISLTPQMVKRFKGRFEDEVAVLHSRLSLGERYDQWRLIQDGKKKVVIGARSAIFAPIENVGLIVVDEEHESSYKSEITPKYLAIDIARYIMKQQKGMLLLGSATPSIETYYKAKQGEIFLFEMKKRVNNAPMPKVNLIDMREELNRGNKSIFSGRLLEEIIKNNEAGQQTMLLLNRRGYSSFVLCRSCGYTVKCINCSVTLTYHAVRERLTCHYCGYTIKTPEECPKCKSRYIRHFGLGTQKLEEAVKKCFPKSTIIRMDSDTTGYKNSHAKILEKFREQNINIMVGTQMIAKGHDFPNVTLVGVMAADGMLNLADYRASEKTFQLLTQVAGRAGRGTLPGRVVIQSYNIDNFSILAACKQDYKLFYNQEIAIRKEMEYPPFTNIALVVVSGMNDKIVQNNSIVVRDMIFKAFNTINESCYEILGPLKPPISRIKSKYRWRLVIKCKNKDILTEILRKTADEFYKRRKKDTVDLGIDIDPINML
jgi:primosomal protein N' (replication factor Y)